MKSRSIFLIGALFVYVFTAQGQVTETHSYRTKKHTFNYAQYGAVDSLRDHLIIALADTTDRAWEPASWAQELTWLADEVNACIISPDQAFGSLSAQEIASFLSERFPGLDAAHIRIIALGAGAKEVCPLLQLNHGALLVSPMKACSINDQDLNNPVGIVNTRSNDSAKVWADSLARAGAWVNQEWVISDEPYYFEHKEEVLLKLWNWVDQQVMHLADSAWLEAYQTKLVSDIPEVVREGKRVELILEVSQAGDFEIDLLDLSAHPVYEIRSFLGKGRHSFEIPTKGLNWGVYKLEVDGPRIIEKHRIMIRG